MATPRILPAPVGPSSQCPPEEIYRKGACTRHDPALFESSAPSDVRQARNICGGCPVAAVCREWAMANEAWGIWGGTTPADRDALRGYPLLMTPEDRAEADLLRERVMRGDKAADIAGDYGVTRRSVERWKSLSRGHDRTSEAIG